MSLSITSEQQARGQEKMDRQASPAEGGQL